mmetsp:Transcript_61956/g.165645  ORF Transcript_61956/g.165645 Transcript_61956/m.165645 type:complete len:142 (+) Transcript_61956:2-427(+)
MAARPGVGSGVLARGRAGQVVLHDPDDPDMSYKVKFEDGTSDWFPQADVVCDASSALSGEADAAEAAERAEKELAALKLRQARHAKAQEAERQKALKEMEEDAKKRGAPGFRDKEYIDAERPKPPAATAAAFPEEVNEEVF